MRDFTFEQADEVYKCCDNHTVDVQVVNNEPAQRFALLLRRLERELGELANESYWVNLLRPFRRYRFNIAVLPLAFNHSICVPINLVQAGTEGARNCKYIYPQFANDVAQLVEAGLGLKASGDAPLLNTVRSLLDKQRDAKKAILLRRSISVAVADQIRRFIEDDSLEFLTPSALLSSGTFKQIILIGPFSWFPENIRSAPRCRALVSVRFDWLADRHELAPSFVCSMDSRSVFPRPKKEYVPQPASQPDDFLLKPEEVAPPLNWSEIGAEIIRQAGTGDYEEELPARLSMLTGNMALFLDASPGATVQVISFTGSKRIDRIRTDDLEPGMYILVRTSGGGNLVAVVADRILKDRAKQARELQKNWKMALLNQVLDKQENTVVRDLARLGCKRAGYQNLRNWMSEKSIRPEFDEDFRSILILCGLGDEEKKIFSNANLLERAHRRAGFQIRQMLLREVSKADLSGLVRDGSIEFELLGAGSGSFTAFRIEDLAPEVKNIPAAQIGQPFNVELFHG
jgi:hypothetical protein